LMLCQAFEYETAFRIMLEEGDDIYLLRLMVQTGPCTKSLTTHTAQKLLYRLNKVVRTGVIQNLALEWIDDS